MPDLLFGRELDTLDAVEVEINKGEAKEEVIIDYENGPVLNKADGTYTFFTLCENAYKSMDGFYQSSNCKKYAKTWRQMTSTEKEVATLMVAKRNKVLRERTGIGNRPRTVPQPISSVVEPAAQPVQAAGDAACLPVALLFPGQGSQYVGMLEEVRDLPMVAEMLATAEEILGYNLLQLCLEGPEEVLAETRHCQPAMFVGGLAALEKLRAEREDAVMSPQCVAGLSLGEYTALCAAGVFTFEEGLRLVQLRGAAMQEAAELGRQAMVSIVGLELEVVEELCTKAVYGAGADTVCAVANVLFPKGFSCAGTEKEVLKLKELAEKKNALQVKVLKTSGGFHTSLMLPAQQRLDEALEEVLPEMRPPRCDVYVNVTGAPLPAGCDPRAIADFLRQQLVSPVMWAPSVQRMIEDGVTSFYECGPQKQIKAMMKRIDQKAWGNTTSVEV